MEQKPGGPKPNAVKNFRKFYQKLREETREKAKNKAEERRKKIKDDRAASPQTDKRRDLDL